MKPRANKTITQRQQGIGVIAALIVLVMLAAISASVVRLNWGQQMGSAQDILGAKASLAAGAGAEWGLYQAINASGSWNNCTNSTQTLDLTATMGFRVTVTCTSNATAFVEGADSGGAARSVRVYKIDAVACTGSGNCPDNTAALTSTYVERHRQVMATNIDTDE
jgi:MSHA biogenesis protein MshP